MRNSNVPLFPLLPLLPLFASSIALAACGGQTAGGAAGDESDSGALAHDGEAGATIPAAASSSSGAFTIMGDRPVAGNSTGAEYRLEASFVAGAATCGTPTIGACRVNPCYGASPSSISLPLPNVGRIQFSGAQVALLALEPTSNGSYATLTVQGEVPWDTGGESVSVVWAHTPDNETQAGGSMELASPPYVALSPGSALGASAGTISREQDLALSWTSDSQPSNVDEVLVDVTLGPTQIACVFGARAGAGVVPAKALSFLGTGTGTYDVHSKEYASVPMLGTDGTKWVVGFNVDAHARAASGLAYGAVTID